MVIGRCLDLDLSPCARFDVSIVKLGNGRGCSLRNRFLNFQVNEALLSWRLKMPESMVNGNPPAPFLETFQFVETEPEPKVIVPNHILDSSKLCAHPIHFIVNSM